jgi:hypothetical protein
MPQPTQSTQPGRPLLLAESDKAGQSQEAPVGGPKNMNPGADPQEGHGSACSTRGGPVQEHQTELANLDLVAVDQHREVDRFMIECC